MYVAPVAEPVAAEGGSLSVPPRDGKLSDPMLLFLPANADFEKAAAFSEAAKRVAVAVAGRDGRIDPAGSKVVWPVSCVEKRR